MNRTKFFLSKQSWIWPYIGSLLIYVVISFLSEGGFNLKTLFLNMTLATFAFLLGVSEMLVITSGDGAIDMSVPYTVTLCAYISAAWLREGSVLAGILLIIAICVAVGLLNGVINVYFQVPAMIGTLAVGYILYTVVLEYSSNATVQPAPALTRFARIQVGGFSMLTVICIVFAVFMYFVMYRTKFGKELHATGQGHHIAYLAGINVRAILIPVFIASSLIAGATGILLGAYMNGSFQSMGDAYQMPAIAAALVGGTLVSGGKSSVIGTFGGVVMLTLLGTLITITRLSAGWRDIIQGAVIVLILAAAADPTAKRS
ncbi:ABC transporter permease [Synergistales bacterium]|nr:ABC transporter permease [Synergistales bacterium]